MKTLPILVAAVLALHTIPLRAAPATSFNYQGYLAENNGAAAGNYYFQFAVFANATGGASLATDSPASTLPVTQGYFNTVINHAAAPALFADGQVKYLEIRVRKNTTDPWTTLAPRQQIHPAPMAQNVESILTKNNSFTGNNIFNSTTSFNAGSAFNGALFSGATSIGGTTQFTTSPTFNQNATMLGDLLLNGLDSQFRLTTDAHLAATIDGSHTGGTWLTLINQRSVFSANDNPQEWNLIATGFENGEGPRKLLLRDGTAGAIRLTVDSQGDLGIGTTNPQGKLDVFTSSTRSLRIKDDLVPTIEATSTDGNDGLRGFMRVRNVMEVFPRADGTAAGKVDVRNTAGTPTIALDGGSGNVSATTISAANMPAIAYRQTAAPQRGGNPAGSINAQQNKDIDTLDITAPAAGFLMVQATIQTGASGGGAPFDTGAYFKLMAGPPGGTLVEQIENGSANGASGYVVIPINWVIPVTAGQNVRLVTNLYNRVNASWNYYNHTLHAIFIPNQL